MARVRACVCVQDVHGVLRSCSPRHALSGTVLDSQCIASTLQLTRRPVRVHMGRPATATATRALAYVRRRRRRVRTGDESMRSAVRRGNGFQDTHTYYLPATSNGSNRSRSVGRRRHRRIMART